MTMAAVVKALKITTVSLLSLVVLLNLLLWFVDFGFLKPKVEAAVSELTGRDFHIAGDLSVSILPTPTLSVENVSLANADWGTDPTMLSVEKAYLKVEVLSLLSQPILISRVELNNLKLLAETGTDNQVNWAFLFTEETGGEASGEEGSSAASDGASVNGLSIPVVIQSADINDIQITYRQPGEKDQTVRLETLSATGEEGVTTLLKGKAHYGKWPVEIKGAVSEHHTDAELGIDQVKITSQFDFPSKAFDFDITISSLAKVGSALQIDSLSDKLLPDEPLSVKGSIVLADDSIQFNKVVAAITGVQLTTQGMVEIESGLVKLDSEVTVDRLNRLGPELPEQPLEVSTELTIDKNQIDISDYQAKVGDSDISGSANIELGDELGIKAQVTSKSLDLTPFFPVSEDVPANDSVAPVAQSAVDHRVTSSYIFDETPLPLDVLRTLNMTLDADIDALTLHDVNITDLKIMADAHNGSLTLSNSFSGFLGGYFENTVNVATSDEQADIEFDAKVRDIRIVPLSGKNIPKEEIPVTNLNIHLKSTGATPRALASNLDGDVVVNQGAGKVNNELIQRFSGDVLSQLFTALNPFSQKQKYTNWQCSLFALNFKSGFGRIKGFLLQSDQLMVVGGGNINLNNETLDIVFNTKPRTGVGVSADMFVTPFVKLGGTLAQPSVGLNKKGVVLSGGAAFLTGGMSFLYTGLMDRATANADRCGEAQAAIEDVMEEVESDNTESP